MTPIGDHVRYLGARLGLGALCRLGTGLLVPLRPLLPASYTRLDRPIFIVGCSPSGTAMFSQIFGAHPVAASWADATQIWSPRPLDGNADDFLDERHAGALECARLQSLYGLFTRFRGKTRMINRNNHNALRLRFLNRAFPDCMIVHVVHDARPVVYSSVVQTRRKAFGRKMPFGNFAKPIRWREYAELPLVERFAHQWADITKYVRTEGNETIGPDRYIELRFEDFRAHPEFELARIDAFCDLDFALRDLSPVDEVSRRRDEVWRGELTPNEVDRIHAIAGSQMNDLGYRWD